MAKIKINGVPTNLTNKSVGQYNPHLDYPKLNGEDINPVKDKINSTVKPVDEEFATIEAEKDELIIKSGLTGIWKIKGKKHSDGGTKLNPEPGSFIFSNDPTLSITKKDKELFNFDLGGSIAKRKNTPAKLLEKEIDLAEYNRYMTILQNPKAEKIEKATAALMVDKYQKIIGQVAYLQEAKKNTTIPEFAMGTAPLKNPDLQNKEDEQEMYEKGGLTKMSLGDLWCPCGKDPVTKDCLPCAPEVYQNIRKNKARKVDVAPTDYKFLNKEDDGSSLYGKFGTIPGSKKQMTNNAWSEYLKNETPAQRAKRKLRESTEGRDTEDYIYTQPEVERPTIPEKPHDEPENPVDHPQETSVPVKPGEGNLPYDIKGYLTPAQKANLSYLGLQAMGIKRYMPMREQIHLGRVNLDKINLQPFLTGLQGQEFQAYNASKVTNPRQAALLNSNILGKGMDSEIQARGQVANQNVQIGNQENLTNLQQSNQEQLFNIPASGKYYDQTVASAQNFDNERRFANNQFMSTLNKYQSDADSLAWSLASVNKYGTRKVVDPKTGKIYNQPVPLYEYKSDGRIVYNSDVASLNMASGKNQINSPEEVRRILDGFGININTPEGTKAAYAISQLMKSMGGQGTKNTFYNSDPTQ